MAASTLLRSPSGLKDVESEESPESETKKQTVLPQFCKSMSCHDVMMSCLALGLHTSKSSLSRRSWGLACPKESRCLQMLAMVMGKKKRKDSILKWLNKVTINPQFESGNSRLYGACWSTQGSLQQNLLVRRYPWAPWSLPADLRNPTSDCEGSWPRSSDSYSTTGQRMKEECQ